MAKFMNTYQNRAADESLRLDLEARSKTLPQKGGVLNFVANFSALRLSLKN